MGSYSLNSYFLVGKPNSGKSSLFNQLTGLNQKIGNFSGVTVDIKNGTFLNNEIIDLPGLESIITNSVEAKNYILKAKEDKKNIIFVANGMQLSHSLMLFSQIADLQIPCLLVLNFKDEIEKNNIIIDTKVLKNRLGCDVVLINSRTGEGLDILKQKITNNKFYIPNSINKSFFEVENNNKIENNYVDLVKTESNLSFWKADIAKRSKIISQIIQASVQTPKNIPYSFYTNKIDRVLLHPLLGIFIFLGVLYLVFQTVFFVSSFPMDWIDSGLAWLSNFFNENIKVNWLKDVISNAVIPGIAGVLIFVPQIAILFTLIGFLEQVGYMSRISFIADNFLKKFGLSGHSVIPLVSSWACAIPAIMSTRIIENPKERFAAIIAIPFMTCSARLPVYTILITMLFPINNNRIFDYRGLTLLALYLLGIIATLFSTWLINKYSTIPSNTNWVLELPIYRKPAWKNLCISVYQKTKSFVLNAGKIIFSISILLWVLASFSPKNENFVKEKAHEENISYSSSKLEYSYLGYAGKIIEPIIKPLGYDWKIGVALLSSFAAREVFVGTLSTIYSINSNDEKGIINRLKNEKKIDGTPVFTKATSVSLLLFYVFAMQCMSTLAIVVKETNTWKYAILQLLFMNTIAYISAFLIYQVLK